MSIDKENLSSQLDVLSGKDELVARRRLARYITLLESTKESESQVVGSLISTLRGRELCADNISWRIAVTGSGGSGKSTLIERLGIELLGRGRKLSVLAIDPSSVRGKGSVMGDKTRMPLLTQHPYCYVRPSSSEVGGSLHRRTRDVLLLCEAAGFDTTIIETVGSGQSDIAIDSIADLSLVVISPCGGDYLQAIKRGILEAADIFVVSKGDGELKKYAEKTQQELLFASVLHGNNKHVCLVSAHQNEGIKDLCDKVVDFFSNQPEKISLKRDLQLKYLMEKLFKEKLYDKITANKVLGDYRKKVLEEVLGRTISVEEGIEKMLANLDITFKSSS